MYAREQGDDVPLPTSNVFAKAPTCNPQNTAAQRHKQPDTVNDAEWNKRSQRLRDNLEDAGCACPGNSWSHAHHILQKAGPGQAGRDYLKRDCGIDIHEAANGVCLPSSKRVQEAAGTKAVVHPKAVGAHRATAQRKILERIREVGGTQCEDPDAVRRELERIGDELREGCGFWNEPNGLCL